MDDYKHDVTCKNCKHQNMLRIPKGTTIAQFLVNRICNNCGCLLKGSSKLYLNGQTHQNQLIDGLIEFVDMMLERTIMPHETSPTGYTDPYMERYYTGQRNALTDVKQALIKEKETTKAAIEGGAK